MTKLIYFTIAVVDSIVEAFVHIVAYLAAAEQELGLLLEEASCE
jgi:hypothetical protein